MPLPRYWVCWPEPRQPGRTSTAEPSQKARFRNLHSYSLDRRPGPVIQDRLGQQGALPAAFRTNDESKAAIRRLVRIRELLGDIRPCRNDISTPYNLGATEQLDGLRFALTPQHPSLNRHGAIRVRYSPDPASGEVLPLLWQRRIDDFDREALAHEAIVGAILPMRRVVGLR